MTVTTDVTEDRVVLTPGGSAPARGALGPSRGAGHPRAAGGPGRPRGRLGDVCVGVGGSRMVPCLGASLVSPWLRTGPVAPTRSSRATRDGGSPTPRSGSWSSIHLRRPWAACASACSPLARALLGRHASDRFEVASPDAPPSRSPDPWWSWSGWPCWSSRAGPGAAHRGLCPARHRVRLGPALADAAPRDTKRAVQWVRPPRPPPDGGSSLGLRPSGGRGSSPRPTTRPCQLPRLGPWLNTSRKGSSP